MEGRKEGGRKEGREEGKKEGKKEGTVKMDGVNLTREDDTRVKLCSTSYLLTLSTEECSEMWLKAADKTHNWPQTEFKIYFSNLYIHEKKIKKQQSKVESSRKKSDLMDFEITFLRSLRSRNEFLQS